MAILDQFGRPIAGRRALRTERAAATTTGVRQPWSDHPAAGLTPARLRRILDDAEYGDADAFLELAEDLEERDPHYRSVLGTRRMAVAQLEITVEAATDGAGDVAAAELVREWLKRETLETEVLGVLDALGKGVSATELIWDTSAGQWWPARLEWRDPRWFRYDRVDARTLRLRELTGEVGLEPGKWIIHEPFLKAGVPIRGGLARPAAWAHLFKSMSVKDWVIFAETYGHPLRLGRYPAGSSETEKAALLDALRALGADAAAIAPTDAVIEMLSAQVTASADLYEQLCRYLDEAVSKLVLGQTTTTDAITGGHAVSREHQEVRADIERADAVALAATLQRDLVVPLVLLNLGRPANGYPRLRIGRADEMAVETMISALSTLVPMGLKVGMSVVRDRLGLPDPDPREDILVAPSYGGFDAAGGVGGWAEKPPLGGFARNGLSGQGRAAITHAAPFNTRLTATFSPPGVALMAAGDETGIRPEGEDTIDRTVDALLADGEPLTTPLVDAVVEAYQVSESIEDFWARVVAAAETAGASEALARRLGELGFAARVAGRAGLDL